MSTPPACPGDLLVDAAQAPRAAPGNAFLPTFPAACSRSWWPDAGLSVASRLPRWQDPPHHQRHALGGDGPPASSRTVLVEVAAAMPCARGPEAKILLPRSRPLSSSREQDGEMRSTRPLSNIRGQGPSPGRISSRLAGGARSDQADREPPHVPGLPDRTPVTCARPAGHPQRQIFCITDLTPEQVSRP